MVLSLVKIIHMPFGGSITLFSMLAAVLTGYCCGPKWGIISGVALGFLNIVFGGELYYPAQVLLDYVLGFGVLGLSGFFRKLKNGLYVGYIVSIGARFFCSFLSGVLFFGSYAPEGLSPVVYSFLYNIFYIGGEGVLTAAVLCIPSFRKVIERLKGGYY